VTNADANDPLLQITVNVFDETDRREMQKSAHSK